MAKAAAKETGPAKKEPEQTARDVAGYRYKCSRTCFFSWPAGVVSSRRFAGKSYTFQEQLPPVLASNFETPTLLFRDVVVVSETSGDQEFSEDAAD